MSSIDLHKVALDYHARGWNVLPVDGKRPNVSWWKKWQTNKQDVGDINRLKTYWDEATGIAVMCGSVSGNLVVIDLDGQQAIDLFYSQFPQLTKTHTVRTGNGLHLYFYQHDKFITDGKANHKIVIGDGEISVRVQNCYVVAPPSLHPSGKRYEEQASWNIKRTATLGRVLMWMKQYKAQQQPEKPAPSVETEQNSPSKPPGSKKQSSTQVDPGKAWGKSALEAEVRTVSSADKGGRNDQLYASAVKLGSIVAGGYLDEMHVISMLLLASRENGLSSDDGIEQCNKTILSGLTVGKASPRHPSNDSAPLPSSGKKPDLDKSPDDKKKPKSKTHKPTDDELGNEMIEECDGNYCFFFGAWNQYENGVWTMLPRFKRKIWQVLIANKHLGIRPTDSKATSVEKYLQMELYVDDEEIDSNTDYINLENGLYNLKTGKLESHSRDLYMTSQLPFAYDPKATCPTFAKFINQVLVKPDGKPDTDLIKVVKQAFGYSLTGDTSLRTSFWLVGPSGSGKSTLLNVLIELAGNSHVAIDLNEMQNTSYQLADIAGKRVVTFTEPDSNTVLADGQYKRLVSQDTITARQVYGKPFRFVPIAKLWGAMNDTPRLIDRSDAIHNRVIIIPMNHVIPRDEWDLQLINKIRLELAGVFNWSIQGLKSLRNSRNWHYSEQVEKARNDYKSENDIEAAFVEDWCVVGSEHSIQSQRLYDAYNAWCRRNGSHPKSKRKVSKDWKRLGFVDYKNSVKFYRGVTLTEEGERLS